MGDRVRTLRELERERDEAVRRAEEAEGLLRELFPLAFPERMVYTAQMAGEVAALKDKVRAHLKGDRG